MNEKEYFIEFWFQEKNGFWDKRRESIKAQDQNKAELIFFENHINHKIQLIQIKQIN